LDAPPLPGTSVNWIPISAHLPHPTLPNDKPTANGHSYATPSTADATHSFYLASPPIPSNHPSNSISTTSDKSSQRNSPEFSADSYVKSELIYAQLPLTELHLNGGIESDANRTGLKLIPIGESNSSVCASGALPVCRSFLLNPDFKRESGNCPVDYSQCSECVQYFQQVAQCYQCDPTQYCGQCEVPEKDESTKVGESNVTNCDKGSNHVNRKSITFQSPASIVTESKCKRLTNRFNDSSSDSNANNSTCKIPKSASSQSLWTRDCLNTSSSKHASNHVGNRRLNRLSSKALSADQYEQVNDSINCISPNSSKMNVRQPLIAAQLKGESNGENIGLRSCNPVAASRSFDAKPFKTYRNARTDSDNSSTKTTTFNTLVRKLNKSNLNADRKLSFASNCGDELIVKRVPEPSNRLTEDEPDDGYEDDDLDRKSSISPASFVQGQSTGETVQTSSKVKMIRAEDLEADLSCTKQVSISKQSSLEALQTVANNSNSVIDQVFQSVLKPNLSETTRPMSSSESHIKTTKNTFLTRQSKIIAKKEELKVFKDKKTSKPKLNCDRNQNPLLPEKSNVEIGSKCEMTRKTLIAQSNSDSNFDVDSFPIDSPVNNLVECQQQNDRLNVSQSNQIDSEDCKTMPSTNDVGLTNAHTISNVNRSTSSERPLRMSSLPVLTALRLTGSNVVPGRVRLRWTWLDEIKPLQKTDFLVELSSERNGHWRIAHRCSAHQCRLNSLPTGLQYRFRVRTVVEDKQLISDTLTLSVPCTLSSTVNGGQEAASAESIQLSDKTDRLESATFIQSSRATESDCDSITLPKSIYNSRLIHRFQSSTCKIRSLLNRLSPEQLFALFFLILFAFISCAIAFSFQHLTETW
jgi:hypothetical protein